MELNPFSPSSVRRFLAESGIRPSRRLGQSFLVDKGTASRIVAASGLAPGETCVEIGAGLGSLTGSLVAAGARVTAVEVDHRLVETLRQQFAGNPAVNIVDADFLRVDMDDLLGPKSEITRVVANIPYSITTPIIEKLLAHKGRLSGIALLVQKEVAERITATPGTAGYSSLTVFCGYHATARLAFTVSRRLFFPEPDVDSALLLLTPEPPRLPEELEPLFFRALRAAFSQRRKKIANCLASGLAIAKSNTLEVLDRAAIPESVRAEDLSLEDYLRLAAALRDVQPEVPR